MPAFRFLLFAALLPALPATVWAQGLGIGTSTPNPSAALDVTALDKGVLLPRLTATQRAAIAAPATGLLVFQTDGTPGFYYNAGTPAAPNWQPLTSATSVPATSADNGLTVNSGRIQLGGSLLQPTVISQNGYPLILNGGFLGIGATVPPTSPLTVMAAPAAPLTLFRNTSPFGFGELRMQDDTGGINFAVGMNNTGTATPGLGFVWNYQPYGIRFGTNALERMRLTETGRLGLGTQAPGSTLDVQGSEAGAYLEASTSLTLSEVHRTVRGLAGCSSITLPQPGTCFGRLYTLINATSSGGTANSITLLVDTSGVVYDDATGTALSSLPPATRLTLQSNGSKWIVVSR